MLGFEDAAFESVAVEPKSPVPLFGALPKRFGLGTVSVLATLIVSSRSSADSSSVSLICPDSASETSFSDEEDTTTFLNFYL